MLLYGSVTKVGFRVNGLKSEETLSFSLGGTQLSSSYKLEFLRFELQVRYCAFYNPFRHGFFFQNAIIMHQWTKVTDSWIFLYTQTMDTQERLELYKPEMLCPLDMENICA